MPLDNHTRAFLDKANVNPPPPPGSVPLEAFRDAAAALRPLGWDREDVVDVSDLRVPVAGAPDVPVRLGVLGESSGGNVAAAATLLARERGDVHYAHQTLLLPVLAIRFDSVSWQRVGADYLLTRDQLEWSVEQYAPGVDRDNPLLSP